MFCHVAGRARGLHSKLATQLLLGCECTCLIGLWVLRGKVIAATNRPDTLDPALLRSGRLDRKIELPAPSEDSRARIMQIHSRKMNIDKEGKSAAILPAAH